MKRRHKVIWQEPVKTEKPIQTEQGQMETSKKEEQRPSIIRKGHADADSPTHKSKATTLPQESSMDIITTVSEEIQSEAQSIHDELSVNALIMDIPEDENTEQNAHEETDNAESLEDKLHKIKEFKCQMCNTTFTKKGSLISHIREVHEKIRRFACHMCLYTTNRKYALSEHIKRKHQVIMLEEEVGGEVDQLASSEHKRKENILSKDNTTLLTQNALIMDVPEENTCEEQTALTKTDHVDSPEDKLNKIENLKCQMCNTTFTKNSNLLSHIREVHEKIRRFGCHMCLYTTNRIHALSEHIKRKHQVIMLKEEVGGEVDQLASSEPEPKDNILSKENTTLLTKIATESHNKYKNAEESIPEDTNTAVSNLNMSSDNDSEGQLVINMEVDEASQMKGHEGESIYVQEKGQETTEDEVGVNCPLCPFKAADKIIYDEHLINVHEIVEVSVQGHEEGVKTEDRETKSNVLNHARTEKISMEKYLKEKTCRIGGKQDGVVECDKCNFTTKWGAKHLRDHEERVHEGITYTCDICGKIAKRQGNIDDHKRRMHEGVKRFKCSVCGFANYEKKTVFLHVKDRHHIDVDSKIKEIVTKINWKAQYPKTIYKPSVTPEEKADKRHMDYLKDREKRIEKLKRDVEEVDRLTTEYPQYAFNKIGQVTEEMVESKSSEAINASSWECKLCKTSYLLTNQVNHLLHYHNMTLTEYLRIQSLNELVGRNIEVDPATCLNLETRDNADITQLLTSSNWNVA